MKPVKVKRKHERLLLNKVLLLCLRVLKHKHIRYHREINAYLGGCSFIDGPYIYCAFQTISFHHCWSRWRARIRMLLYMALLAVDLPSKAPQKPSPPLCLKAFVQLKIRSEKDGGISCLLAIRTFILVHCCFVWWGYLLQVSLLSLQTNYANLDLFDRNHVNTAKQQEAFACPLLSCLILDWWMEPHLGLRLSKGGWESVIGH